MIRSVIQRFREARGNGAASAPSSYPNNQPRPDSDQSNDPTLLNESASEGPTRSKWEIWAPRLKLGVAIFLPCFLETLDYTVVATSQTNIASVFNRLDLQSYIGTAYVLGSTVFLPIFASVADVFGRYLTMQASVFIFLVGSAISTGAHDMPTLLVGRGIAGIGAAGLLTLVRIILSDSASLDDNNVQGAIMIIVYSVGFSVGPTIGGALLTTSWRWVFGINLPVCAVSMVLMAVLLPPITKGPQPAQRLNHLPPDVAKDLQSRTQDASKFSASLYRLDLIGAFIFIVFGILILLGLNWGSTEEWNSPKVIICLSVGGALILVFIVWEYLVDHSTDHLAVSPESDVENPQCQKGPGPKQGTRARVARLAPGFVYLMDPMIPMNIFRSFDVIATNLATMASGMVMLGVFYFVAIFYVIVNGSDAIDSGVQLLYFAPGLGIGSIISIYLVKWLRQPKWTIILACTILPIGIGFLAEALYDADTARIKGFMIMSGTGVGMGFGPLAFQARFDQSEERVAVVVATNLFFRTLGGTVGLAQLSAVMYSRVRRYINQQIYTGAISIADAIRISSSLSSVGSEASGSGINALPEPLKTVTTDAFRDGLRWAFFSLLPWLGLTWFMVLFLRTLDPERLDVKPGQATNKESEGDREHEKRQQSFAPHLSI